MKHLRGASTSGKDIATMSDVSAGGGGLSPDSVTPEHMQWLNGTPPELSIPVTLPEDPGDGPWLAAPLEEVMLGGEDNELELEDGWVDLHDWDPDIAPAGWYKHGDRIFLRGAVQADGSNADGIVAVLPPQARPEGSELFLSNLSGNSGLGLVEVRASGELASFLYDSGSIVFLSQMSFRSPTELV